MFKTKKYLSNIAQIAQLWWRLEEKLPGTFKLLHLQAKKYVDKGGGGQKLPIVRRHSLWTPLICTSYGTVVTDFDWEAKTR